MKFCLTWSVLLVYASISFGLTITGAEYFINTDPGPGNGTPISVIPGEDVAITDLLIPSAALNPNASHDLYIRYQSAEGQWGNTERRHFFIHDPIPSGYAGRDIISVEYWFDDGSPIPFDLDDDPYLVHAILLPTSGLETNSAHKLSVRFFRSHGVPGDVFSRYFFIHEPIPGIWYSRDIAAVEYHFDDLPPTVIDLGNNFEVDYYDSISVAGLETNMAHKLSVRYQDEDGKWSNYEARYVFVIQSLDGTAEFYDITHVEYSFDDANPVQVDISDGQDVDYSEMIPSLGLETNQAHKLDVRYLDSRGYWSNSEARYVFVHESEGGSITLLNLVSMEYWIDNGTPISVDIADAMSVSFNDLLPHNAGPGPHNFYLRYVDETGTRTNIESLPFFVWTGAGPSNPAILAGAEYFLNVDPGVGNGVQIDFPQDGLWDEGEENGHVVFTELPVGVHYFGIRFRDELGNWSMTLADTFVVGPVLVISVDGSNIVLDWTANPDHIPFHVFRADSADGTYTEIGTSTGLNYTDSGILDSEESQYYRITTTTNVLSRFRLPAESVKQNRTTR
ncbi:MAG: hypothetical protein KDB65_02010 [Calditrichaeota bacterium]|nr:hypothetical protein [Calditrichota bacterium]